MSLEGIMGVRKATQITTLAAVALLMLALAACGAPPQAGNARQHSSLRENGGLTFTRSRSGRPNSSTYGS
jgi:hypothetical protein